MKRVIYSNNGTLEDFTYSLSDIYSSVQAFTFVALEDKFYIGSTLPFNNIYIDMGAVVNSETSVMSLKIWDGTEWNSAVEIVDGTAVSGATLAQSGTIQFVPDKNKSWGREDTEDIPALSNITIYDRYWIELSMSADLAADVELNWVGNIFSNDNQLGAEFPELIRTNVLSAYETGKTNWEDQHQVAATIIEKDLIAKGKIKDGNQILTIEDLALASVQKVAAIIFNALGDDYVDQYLAAEKEYRIRLAKSYVVTDKNNDGKISPAERKPVIGKLYR